MQLHHMSLGASNEQLQNHKYNEFYLYFLFLYFIAQPVWNKFVIQHLLPFPMQKFANTRKHLRIKQFRTRSFEHAITAPEFAYFPRTPCNYSSSVLQASFAGKFSSQCRTFQAKQPELPSGLYSQFCQKSLQSRKKQAQRSYWNAREVCKFLQLKETYNCSDPELVSKITNMHSINW